MKTDDVMESASAVADEVQALRREIHAHPELGLHNPETQQRIVAALGGLPLEVRTGTACTSVVADLAGPDDGPTLLLRADTDALPMTEDTDVEFRSTIDGRAHACGHDAHVAMLVGAAKVLCDRRDQLPGPVRFMFQPGEEGFGGADVMMSEGVLEGVDRAFAIHITPNIPSGFVSCRPGPIMASADTFHVKVTGRGGHASTPHFCVDPIPAAAAMISGVQTVVAREMDPFNPALVTVANVHAGTTTNVTPETAVFEGTIRAVSESVRADVHAALERMCRHVGQAHRCEVDFEIQAGYPVTINHAEDVARVSRLVHEAIGENRYFELPTPVMGAEDFSYVLQVVPGAMALLGVCPDDIANSLEAPSCHSNRMRLNEDALATGVALHCAVALSG
ncbi:MAG: M20 family metallopeptidase [Acidimicrobiia bacterium]|nr:M20 family metallopeptidase [Acidimicrobiia bacterium]MDH5238277.1 M20 family metallopeptidase [Acidimicrobiia bacterium]